MKDSNTTKDTFETKNKELKTKCDEQLVNLNEVSKEKVINDDSLKHKTKQVEIQMEQIEVLQ